MTVHAANLCIEYAPLDELLPYARNAKLHTPEQVEAIARSIEQFGFNNPVLVRPDGSILAGHGRTTRQSFVRPQSPTS